MHRLAFAMLAACSADYRVEVSVAITLTGDDPAAATIDLTATAEELSGHGDHPGVSGLDIAVVLDGRFVALPQAGEGTYSAPQQVGFPGTVLVIVDGDMQPLARSEPFTLSLTSVTLVIDPPIDAVEQASAFIEAAQFTSLALAAGTETLELPASTRRVDVSRVHAIDGGFHAATLVDRSCVITGSACSDLVGASDAHTGEHRTFTR